GVEAHAVGDVAGVFRVVGELQFFGELGGEGGGGVGVDFGEALAVSRASGILLTPDQRCDDGSDVLGADARRVDAVRVEQPHG
ncbi:hypothetical protein KBZ21_40110, partial [Streptomyces sp. A73]|nr:hypothetical protein [Streptomyces sp. A73]